LIFIASNSPAQLHIENRFYIYRRIKCIIKAFITSICLFKIINRFINLAIMSSIERFWYILFFLCLTLFVGTSIAEYVQGSYLTINQCITATEVNATYPNDPGWQDAKVGERIRFVNFFPF